MNRTRILLLASTMLFSGCVSQSQLSSEVWKTEGLKEQTALLLLDCIPQGSLRVSEKEVSIGEKMKSPRGYWITYESAEVINTNHCATFRSPTWCTMTSPGCIVHVRPHEELSYTLVSNNTNRINLKVRYPTKNGGLIDLLFWN